MLGWLCLAITLLTKAVLSQSGSYDLILCITQVLASLRGKNRMKTFIHKVQKKTIPKKIQIEIIFQVNLGKYRKSQEKPEKIRPKPYISGQQFRIAEEFQPYPLKTKKERPKTADIQYYCIGCVKQYKNLSSYRIYMRVRVGFVGSVVIDYILKVQVQTSKQQQDPQKYFGKK